MLTFIRNLFIKPQLSQPTALVRHHAAYTQVQDILDVPTYQRAALTVEQRAVLFEHPSSF